MRRQANRNRGLVSWAAAAVLTAVTGLPVAAGESATRPSPRTAVEIGGASVVMVVANEHLYAFVDRVEDNAPLADAVLSVDQADGANLRLTRVSDGLFVAPFNHAGRLRDGFMVSLVSSAGTGDAAAEIGYGDASLPEIPGLRLDLRANLALALVSGAGGAALASAVMLLARGRRRGMPVASAPAGSAMVA